MSQAGEQVTSSVVSAPVAKAASAWVGVGASIGITSWSDLSAALTAFSAGIAALYTLALFSELLWKKAIRPYCEYRGWIKRQQRRKNDTFDTV